MPMMTSTEYDEKIKHINKVIDRQIYLCDDKDDVLIYATAMLAKARNIFKEQIGVEHTSSLLRSIATKLETDMAAGKEDN